MSIPVPITAIYAVVLGLIGSYLAFRVGSLRGSKGVSILWGDDMEIALEMRRHGNFVEYVPFALILMMIVELNGAGSMLLHGTGVLLVVSRIAHPIGLKADDTTPPLRAVGAAGTLLATVILMGTAVWQLL